MSWTTPKIEDLNCGMEVSMYYPADEGDPFFLARLAARQKAGKR